MSTSPEPSGPNPFQQAALNELDSLKSQIVAGSVVGYGLIAVSYTGSCHVRFNGSNLAALYAGAAKLCQILLDAIFTSDPTKPGKTN